MFEQPADFSFEFFSSSELINILHGFSHISGTTLSVISFTGNSDNIDNTKHVYCTRSRTILLQAVNISSMHVPYFRLPVIKMVFIRDNSDERGVRFVSFTGILSRNSAMGYIINTVDI